MQQICPRLSDRQAGHMVVEIDTEFVPEYQKHEPSHVRWRFFQCTACAETISFGPAGIKYGDHKIWAFRHLLCDGQEVDIVSGTIVTDGQE